ncbi:MAG: calcineurin-like phosphoesterase C-terminal domain-containing protein [Bacteroidales bacterium]|nr:calcineurin-like phosphoesterase C-terminal domain-containing protein [Bacteroidales bacterium]
MKKFLSFNALSALLLAAGILMISCGGSGTEGPDQPEVKVVATNVSVPASAEVTAGENLTFTLRGKTNFSADDQVILRSASNTDYPCTMVSFNDGTSMVVRLPENIVSGSYKVYVKHGGQNYYVSQFNLTILKPLVIEPANGVNIYGIVQCDGKGVPNVLVSDGSDIVKTDENGIYQIKSQKQWKYVFVIVPSGYEVPSDGILPEFHSALSQPAEVAERKDFELVKVDNDNFTLFVLGDMHLANRTDDLKQIESFATTLNASISASKGKRYCLTLGDMTWDLYWDKYQFPDYLKTVNELFKNILFFHTMGNHDNDMNKVGDFNKSFEYTRDIAPTFYSFNLGKIHFIVLDNIDYNDVGTGSDNRKYYVLDYTAEQMEWLRKDLAFVPKNTPVFITSHAPVSRPNGSATFNDQYMSGANSAGEANMADFINAVKDYNVHFLSGHTHNIFHRKHSAKFSEHNEGAVCASWWWSGHLTPGIHVSQDGAPGGYGVWEFTGEDFKYSFRAAGHDENYQFRAYDMNKVQEVVAAAPGAKSKYFTNYAAAIAAYPANTILVNVWDWDADWKVSISEGGQELTVTKDYAYDPVHIMALTSERLKSNPSDEPSFLTTLWPHFFKAKASSPSSTVTIKVTDRNGKTYTETMKRPKAFDLGAYKNN